MTHDAKLPLFNPGLFRIWGSLLGFLQEDTFLNILRQTVTGSKMQLALRAMPLFI